MKDKHKETIKEIVDQLEGMASAMYQHGIARGEHPGLFDIKDAIAQKRYEMSQILPMIWSLLPKPLKLNISEEWMLRHATEEEGSCAAGVFPGWECLKQIAEENGT